MSNNFCKMSNAFLAVVLMLLSPQSVIAETTDFAFVATLSDGNQSLRQFELPYQVLAKLERQDYGDLRIFNRQNQAVPFKISQPEPQAYQNSEFHQLRFFHLADNSNQRSGLQIEFSENSTRFSFNSVANSSQPNYLLIENQHSTDDLHSLKLHWQQPEHTFSIKAKLESSDDLQNWQLLNDSMTLYDLKYADTALMQNTLSLPDVSHAKYLRLSFQPSSSFTLQIDKISGEYRHSTLVERENWEKFSLQPGEPPNEWLFNIDSFIPVTKIAFEIPAVGLFYQGRLYSKNDSAGQNQPRPNRHTNLKREAKRALHRYPEYSPPEQRDAWHYQATVTQYRLLTASGEIASEPIGVSPSKDRQWKIVLEQPSTLLAEQVPSIKIAWHPVLVTFLAQGKPPYRLFFGNAAVAPINAALPPSLDDNTVETVEVQSIQAVEKHAVTNQQEKLATVIEKLNWQKILLWLLLCSGVLVMAVMAYRLYLRMNKNKD